MKVEPKQLWKDSINNYFVVDGIFDDDKVRCHRAGTTEEIILTLEAFDKLEYLRKFSS